MTTTTQAHEFSYGDLRLTGIDGYGVLWTVEAAEGWHGGPPIRSARQAKAAQDGEWAYTPHYEGRVIRLQGKVFAPDLTALEAAARRLAAIPVTSSLTGSSSLGSLSAAVMLEDAPQLDPIGDSKGVWQFTVAAADPLLYGAQTVAQTSLGAAASGTGRTWPRVWPTDYGVAAGVTPGAVSLMNDGTRAYWPTLRIDGPVPNPTVTLVETGASVRYGGTVPAGQHLDFDLANRRVTIGDNPVSVRTAVTSSGDWLAVPPGGGSITWTADAADPAAMLTVWGYEGAWA